VQVVDLGGEPIKCKRGSRESKTGREKNKNEWVTTVSNWGSNSLGSL
jgi:hypothetical protein